MISKDFIAKYSSVLGIASPEVKLAHDILTGKKTDNPRLFITEGTWALRKLMEKGLRVETFIFDEEYFTGNISEKEASDFTDMLRYSRNSYSVSKKALGKISDRDGADVCFAIAESTEYTLSDIEKEGLPDNLIAMILDGQEQPGNMGAIIRSLDGAGGKFAIVTNQRVKITHTRLVRASLGASFMMPVCVSPMDELIPWLQKNKFRIVLTDLTATCSYRDIPAKGRIAIVAGNEHTGISPVWRTLPESEPVIIPMLGSVESLNVGFASTLVAYDLGLRQKD